MNIVNESGERGNSERGNRIYFRANKMRIFNEQGRIFEAFWAIESVEDKRSRIAKAMSGI